MMHSISSVNNDVFSRVMVNMRLSRNQSSKIIHIYITGENVRQSDSVTQLKERAATDIRQKTLTPPEVANSVRLGPGRGGSCNPHGTKAVPEAAT